MPTPEQMVAAQVARLKERTGRDLDGWASLLLESGIEGAAQQRAWLRSQHALTMPTAFAIVEAVSRAAGLAPSSAAGLLDAQYAGPKASLRAIYDRLVESVSAFGPDVTIEPRQAYTAIARKRQFAAIQPSAITRLDLGLRLDGEPLHGRLQAARNVGGGMITHRIALASTAGVDSEVLAWLRQAYERAG